MAATEGTRILAAVVPRDDGDPYPTHKAKWGKGGLHHVASEADLQNIPEERQTEYMLATVADRSGLIFQLVDEGNDTWQVIDLGSSFKVVEDNTARDSISSDQREEGMIVAVLDPDGAGTNEYKEYQLQGGTTNNDWQEVMVLTPSELTDYIQNDADVSANTSARHSHSNKSVLDNVESDMLDIPVEIVDTNTERDNIDNADREEGMVAIVRNPDDDGNDEFKEYQLQGGTSDGDWTEIKWLTDSELTSFITSHSDVSANTADRHSHSNKTALDGITSAGSGSIITSSERTEISDNTADRHSHSNKSTLDSITQANSGEIITQDERNLITPQRITKTGDFTVAHGDFSVLYFADTSVQSAKITVTLPDDVSNFENMWHAYVMAKGSYEVDLVAGGSASIRSPSSLQKLVEEYAMVSMFHFDEGGNSVWYLEGRLA